MPVARLDAEYQNDPDRLLALCLWREARGESTDAKRAVAWVIKNRCAMAPAQGFKKTIAENIMKPWAFSSFMEGDPNATKYPKEPDASWADCQFAVESCGLVDPTNGATFYFSPPLKNPPSAWGNVEHTVTIGRLNFYKIVV